MVLGGHPGGPRGSSAGSRGSSEWSWRVIVVVREGRLWVPVGHLSGPGGSSWWSMRVVRGVQGVI